MSRQHGGETTADNLAYACMICNRFKGPNVSSADASGAIVRLFNPRSQSWADHFRLSGAVIQSLPATGEATAKLLRLNAAERVVERTVLAAVRPLSAWLIPQAGTVFVNAEGIHGGTLRLLPFLSGTSGNSTAKRRCSKPRSGAVVGF